MSEEKNYDWRIGVKKFVKHLLIAQVAQMGASMSMDCATMLTELGISFAAGVVGFLHNLWSHNLRSRWESIK